LNVSATVCPSKRPNSITEPLFECDESAILYAHPRLQDIALPGSSLKKTLRRFFFKPLLTSRARRLSPIILEALGDCSSLMDLGCGDMILTECLKQTSEIAITALDTVDSNLSQLPLMLYDGAEIPFHDKFFEAAMVSFVLHHCTDIHSVLSEIKRVTSKKIIIMEEIFDGALAKRVLHLHDFGNRFLSSKMHIPLNFLRIEEWHEEFDKLGLRLTNCSRIYQYRRLNLTHQVLFELSVV
jgi:SAM-dependent methyltransferase